MAEQPVRVFLVDDDADDVKLFGMLLDIEPGLELVGSLTDADTLVEEIARLRPDVVLLDLGMPGKNPLTALAETAGREPGAKFIVYSGRDDSQAVQFAVTAGAYGYLVKGCEPETIFAAIRDVAQGRHIGVRR